MHPAFVWHWKRRARGLDDCSGVYAGCGSGRHAERAWEEAAAIAFEGRRRRHHRGGFDEEPFAGGGFGMRRPLRFLAAELDLSEEQIARVAKLLEELKTERAQAAVDVRRAAADLADAVEDESFDRGRAQSARERRLAAAERVQDAATRALEGLHALLEPGQREDLAGLVRTGAFRL